VSVIRGALPFAAFKAQIEQALADIEKE